jgi:hypothetical protein
MIQRGRPTNRVQRKRGREVFHAEYAPPASREYLNWSEHLIGFERSDHPPKILRPGHHALVLEAQIGGFTSKKVFMDGGRSLNLIYTDTLRKIKIPMDNLLPTETSFHGIVPGKPTYPLGAIHLDVIFGTPANLRSVEVSPALKTATRTSTACPRRLGCTNSTTSGRAPTWMSIHRRSRTP